MGQRNGRGGSSIRGQLEPAWMRALAFALLAATPCFASGAASDVQADVDRCTKGDAAACNKAGLAYAIGGGVAKDLARAALLFQKACDGGYANSCTNLGALYANGEGVAQDQKRAAELFRKACQAGLQAGCASLEKLDAK